MGPNASYASIALAPSRHVSALEGSPTAFGHRPLAAAPPCQEEAPGFRDPKPRAKEEIVGSRRFSVNAPAPLTERGSVSFKNSQ